MINRHIGPNYILRTHPNMDEEAAKCTSFVLCSQFEPLTPKYYLNTPEIRLGYITYAVDNLGNYIWLAEKADTSD